jgi:hypothetical protein
MLEANPELDNKFREWSASRDHFLSGLKTGKPEIVEQGWQKDYVRTARGTKVRIAAFVDRTFGDHKQSGASTIVDQSS